MDFKEWFRKHEREVFKRNQGCFDTAYKFGAKQGYEAGQQSKQAEIDALKMSNHHLSVQVLDAEAYSDYWEKKFKILQLENDDLKVKIDKVLYAISQSELHGDRAIWGIQDEIKEILK